ncbi:MAG: hypothetical protein R3326_09770 [Gemmatimonadota bacterium]|nr:hypothetical protein [Gemmatimonadota bacterium]
MDTNADRILFQARLIALALLLGVLLFAGVATWAVGEGAIDAVDAETAGWMVLGWGVVALGCAAGWFVFRRKALDLLTSTRGLREIHHGDVEGPGRAFGYLVVAWALAEAIGILGVTVTMLTGRFGPLVGGVAGTALGIALSWPKPEWFSAFRQGRTPGSETGGETWEDRR